MLKRFKNTATVPALGIAPNGEGSLSVDGDGLLDTAYARSLVKNGTLVEVMADKPKAAPKIKESAHVGS